MPHLPASLLVGLGLALASLPALPLARRGRLDVRRVLLAGALSGMVATGCAWGFVTVLGRGFLGIAMLHAWLFDLSPLVCLGLLLAARRREATASVRVIAWAGLLVLPALWYWTAWVEPESLVVERTSLELPAGREGTAPLVIGVVSDLQTEGVGAHEREAIATLMAEQPDLILFPGDLIQPRDGAHRAQLLTELHELLAPVDAPLGAWVVQGNCERPEQLPELVEGTHLRILQDDVVRMSWRDRTVTLCGIGMVATRPAARAALAQLERDPEAGDIRIAFSHLPDTVRRLPADSRTDLWVAGHTHGGQVALPVLGPLVTLSSMPWEIAAGGLHAFRGTPLYVSRGIGMERGDAPRVRFLCRPELSLVTLRGPGQPPAATLAMER